MKKQQLHPSQDPARHSQRIKHRDGSGQFKQPPNITGDGQGNDSGDANGPTPDAGTPRDFIDRAQQLQPGQAVFNQEDDDGGNY